MSDDFEADEPGQRWWVWLIAAVAAAGAIGMAVALLSGGKAPPKRADHIMHVALPPPPPPPKKPPEPEPLKAPEPLKNQDVSKPSKVVENKPSPKPSPSLPGAPLTAAAGAGTNAYGLAVGNGGGGTIGGGGGGGGGGGSRFGAYAGQIQARIEAALQRDEKTRSGHYLLSISVWLSPTGQVVRVKVGSSSGDPGMDDAIQRVIASVGIGQAPPADMPQPVNLQVRARAG